MDEQQLQTDRQSYTNQTVQADQNIVEGLVNTISTDVPVVAFAFILLKFLINDISKEVSKINDNLSKLSQELHDLKDRLPR